MRGIAVAFVLGILVLIFAAFDSFYTIEPGERGVVVTLGNIVGVADPGTNFKAPFFTQVHTYNVRDQLVKKPTFQVYTRDQQVATIPSVSVNFAIDADQVAYIHERWGSADAMINQIIERELGSNLEIVFGQFNAERAVQERNRLGQEYANIVRTATGPFKIGTVVIEPFDLPDDYERNINERMTAEIGAVKAEQTAKTTVIEARANADAAIETARGKAEAVRLAGEAEAAAIAAKGQALRDNPSLINLITAERWNGDLPQTMLPGGTVPFLDLSSALNSKVKVAQ